MAKVHPGAAAAAAARRVEDAKAPSDGDAAATVLTVWKKSLLLSCNGFTVFDGAGDIVFRVDNYVAAGRNRGEILLMDAYGSPLLTIRRKVPPQPLLFNPIQ